MNIIIELVGCIIFFFLISFPIWINGNWKTIFDKDLNIYYKQLEKDKLQYKQLKIVSKKHICTQHQPYQLNEKEYIICNFICDGNCRFKK
jgi:hypothetical protein